jgi:hypothetical protein
MSAQTKLKSVPRCSEPECDRPAYGRVRVVHTMWFGGKIAGDLCRAHVVALCERTRWPLRVNTTPFLSNAELATLQQE